MSPRGLCPRGLVFSCENEILRSAQNDKKERDDKKERIDFLQGRYFLM
jgi:hypothetical protein